MTLTVHLAQLEPTLGNLDANLALHLAELERAREDGAELVLFPELSLTGYFLKDQTPEVALARDAAPLEALREASRGRTVGVGFVERGDDGRVYNAYALFEDGALLHVHRKVHLVTYGMFEESRDLAAGERFDVASSRLGRIGVLVCEDMWHAAGGWLYFLAGVDLLVVPSAGPARGVSASYQGLASVGAWRALLQSASTLYQCWSLYVNRAGVEDGITFGGGTCVVDPFGHEVAHVDGLDAGRVVHALDLGACERARLAAPLRRDEKPWLVQAALARLDETR
ncbi:MAG: carbon-nitrogen hydrolase [Planctomycetes bacterium]|nr:carbon-nitrogen hydrolase [Planctomycetota bacterium]